MRTKLEVHVVQMTSTDAVEANLSQIQDLLKPLPAASPEAPALVSFPENCLFMRLREGEKVSGLEVKEPIFETLQGIAKAKNFILHLGSIPLREEGHLSNSSVVVWPDGRTEVTYKKIHLFDIDIEGEKRHRESDVFRHGSQPQVLPLSDWQIGQSICYDLRFSDLFHQYALQGVDLILVPSSFLVTTGKAHWEILLRARAIESQAYVVAAAQAGTHKSMTGDGERQTYGHSLVIDPWGRILAKASPEAPQVLSVTLERNEIEKVRRQIPMAGHRRLHRLKDA